MPDVLVVVPTLNEAAHIGAVLSDLLAPADGPPILVLDGGSGDGTRQIVRRLAATDPRIVLLDNPGRTQAHAVNSAARIARDWGASVLVRVDAHARYPAGYVPALVRHLHRTGADSVVVPLVAEDDGQAPWQTANARLQRSLLGHGGSPHRRAGTTGPVTHGHHAAFRVDSFLSLGGYDTGLTAGEDVDFDARLTATGGRIEMLAEMPVRYIPRPGPVDTWRQYRRNGAARAALWRSGRVRPQLRQVLPALALPGTLGFAGLALILPLACLGALFYPTAVLLAAAVIGRGRIACSARIGALAFAMHAGFAQGVWGGLLTVRAPARPSPVPT